jgi:hypothetical protein
MNTHLSRDEFDALEEVSQINRSAKPQKPSACVARNSKRLVGIKFLAHRKDGTFQLTEQGAEALFVKKCIAGLRALAADGQVKVPAEVSQFLIRKSYVTADGDAGIYTVTAKGHECLADIAENG